MATPANVHDSQVLGELLHGQETGVWGDSAYMRQEHAIREAAPKSRNFTNREGCRNRALTEEERTRNRAQLQVRTKVKPPFLVIKRIFGFTKVCNLGDGEAWQTAVCGLCVGELLHDTQAVDESIGGVVYPEFRNVSDIGR